MLQQLLDQAHHAKNINEIARLTDGISPSHELEAELYATTRLRGLDKHQQQLIGLLIGQLYKDRVERFDVPYLGTESEDWGLDGLRLYSPAILYHSANAVVTNCELHGDYAGEKSKNAQIRNSVLAGDYAFTRSREATIHQSTAKGADFGRHSHGLNFYDSTANGSHALSHSYGVRVVNSELRGDKNLCSSSEIAVFSPYIECLVSPRSGVVVADTIGHHETFFDPVAVTVFARSAKQDTLHRQDNKPLPIVVIDNSDIAGEWNSNNLPDRIRHLCQKYGVDVPHFLRS